MRSEKQTLSFIEVEKKKKKKKFIEVETFNYSSRIISTDL